MMTHDEGEREWMSKIASAMRRYKCKCGTIHKLPHWSLYDIRRCHVCGEKAPNWVELPECEG
jgi:hypothetical protein